MPNLAVVHARIAGHYRSIPAGVIERGVTEQARDPHGMAFVPCGEFSGWNNTTEGCPVKVGNFNVTHYVKQFFLGTYQVQIVVFLSPYRAYRLNCPF